MDTRQPPSQHVDLTEPDRPVESRNNNRDSPHINTRIKVAEDRVDKSTIKIGKWSRERVNTNRYDDNY